MQQVRRSGRQEGQHMKEIKILIDDTEGNEVCTLQVSERLETKMVVDCLSTALVKVLMNKTGENEAQANRIASLMFAKAAAVADDGQQEAEKAGQEWKH